MSTEEGRPKNECPFRQKGVVLNPVICTKWIPLWKSRGHFKKRTISNCWGSCRDFQSKMFHFCAYDLLFTGIAKLPSSWRVFSGEEFAARVEYISCGKRDCSALGEINIVKMILQKFFSVCNRWANPTPKWEVKWWSCIILTNGGVELLS